MLKVSWTIHFKIIGYPFKLHSQMMLFPTLANRTINESMELDIVKSEELANALVLPTRPLARVKS